MDKDSGLLRRKRISPLFLVLTFLYAFSDLPVSAEVLTLSEGLRVARENNRLIKIAQRDESVSEQDALIAKAKMKQAEENLRINKVKYEDGVGTATDVLDAVTLLTIAETNYYRSVYDLSRAEAAVLYSMGVELSEVYK